LKMDVAVKGRAGIEKKGADKSTGKDLMARTRRDAGGILSSRAHREILKHAAGSDVSMKNNRNESASKGLVELKVSGWKKSRVAGNADGGVSSLIQWLEKKASTKLATRSRSVKIKKVCCNQLGTSLPVFAYRGRRSSPIRSALVCSQPQTDDRDDKPQKLAGVLSIPG